MVWKDNAVIKAFQDDQSVGQCIPENTDHVFLCKDHRICEYFACKLYLGPIESTDTFFFFNIWLSLTKEKMKPKMIQAWSAATGQGFSAFKYCTSRSSILPTLHV